MLRLLITGGAFIGGCILLVVMFYREPPEVLPTKWDRKVQRATVQPKQQQAKPVCGKTQYIVALPGSWSDEVYIPKGCHVEWAWDTNANTRPPVIVRPNKVGSAVITVGMVNGKFEPGWFNNLHSVAFASGSDKRVTMKLTFSPIGQ